MINTNNTTNNINNQKENYPTSQRRCEINGKRFLVTRYFEGDKDLGTIMSEIAISRANREMGL